MLQLKNVSKFYYPKKGEPVQALKNINLKIADTGMVFVLGKSGSGKSTLLNLIGGLDKYDEGEILIKDKSITDFKKNDYDSYRNTMIGFVFQEYNILDEFTVAQNIILALQLQGIKATNDLLNSILEDVDLVGFGNRNPNELSGGQKQRVAISRALVKNPEIIMADEPTGALDSETGKQIFETLQNLSKTRLVIIVSHDREYAEEYGDRIIEFKDGEIISDVTKENNSNNNVSNLNIVNDTLEVKEGYVITEKDLKLINDYLKGNKLAIKNIGNVSNEGATFSNTNQENIKLSNEKYVPIKSKLPLKVSLKMGASSLKHKKIRLFFSILLASIAFAMFGLADTMGTYKKETSFKQSYYDSEIDQSSFLKYDNKMTEYDRLERNRKKYSKNEVEELIKKYPNLNLMPVFSSTNEDFNAYYGNKFYLGNNFSNEDKYNDQAFISGYSEITDESFKKFNLSFLGTKSRLPNNYNEIVITEYAYYFFNTYNYSYRDYNSDNTITADINEYNDLIGKKIITGENNRDEFTIVGIVDTGFDFERYEPVLSEDRNNGNFNTYFLQNEITELLNGSTHALGFVKEGYVDDYLNNPYFEGNASIESINFQVGDIANINKIDENVNVHYFKNVDPNNLKENDIILSIYKYHNYVNEIYESWDDHVIEYLNTLQLQQVKQLVIIIGQNIEHLEDYINITDEELILNYDNYLSNIQYYFYNKFQFDFELDIPEGFKTKDTIKTELMTIFLNNDASEYNLKLTNYTNSGSTNTEMDIRVVGFIIDDSDNYIREKIYVTTDFMNTNIISDNTYIYDALIGTSFIGNDSYFNDVIKDHFKEEGTTNRMANELTSVFDQLSYTIEETSIIFIYIGIGFVVFASLLLLNFITTSVSYKKQEIGILRAIGARGKDVTKIFFNEALIIALINFVIASIMCFVAVIFINNMLRNDYDILMTILSIGVRQIILILVISVSVAFISSALPVYNIARKRPIDAIRDK